MDRIPVEALEDGDYFERLRGLLSSLLRKQRLPYQLTVRLAGGAYPTDVREALKSLVASGEVTHENGIYSLLAQAPVPTLDGGPVHENSRDSLTSVTLAEVTLSDPHPADYDWRFSLEALGSLLMRLKPLTSSGERTALLGTTTLFPHLVRTGAAVTLFDRSQSLLQDLKAAGFARGLIEHDLFEPLSHSVERFDLVVADPPWYPAFHRAFLLRGCEILREGGLLFLSVLPWLTRPSAIGDRADIVA